MNVPANDHLSFHPLCAGGRERHRDRDRLTDGQTLTVSVWWEDGSLVSRRHIRTKDNLKQLLKTLKTPTKCKTPEPPSEDPTPAGRTTAVCCVCSHPVK